MSIRQRLYPSEGQAAAMLEHAQQARFVYNIGLEQRSLWTEQRRYYTQKVTYVTQAAQLAELRAELDWLRAGSSVVQQGALRDLDQAFQRFFKGLAGHPQFKKRTSRAGSFVVRDLTMRRVGKKWGEVLVPKVGYVRFRLSRSWADVQAATSARISIKHGCWHVALTAVPGAKLSPGTGEMTGIDRGVANTVATSDGEFFQAPILTGGEKARFLALERRFARQTKGSLRRERTLDSLAELRLTLDNRRTDWIEQTTTTLARRYDHVALEKLQIRNMVKRVAPKPDSEDPGVFLPNGQAAKSGLSRAIHASCWGKFATRLGHKTNTVFVNPINTSRECNSCHDVSPDNRKSQAVFECQACGFQAHADTNAAQNILDRSLATPNPGTPGVRTLKPRKSRVNRLAA
jgi:transposase